MVPIRVANAIVLKVVVIVKLLITHFCRLNSTICLKVPIFIACSDILFYFRRLKAVNSALFNAFLSGRMENPRLT
jgi:hypothetical protein